MQEVCTLKVNGKIRALLHCELLIIVFSDTFSKVYVWLGSVTCDNSTNC